MIKIQIHSNNQLRKKNRKESKNSKNRMKFWQQLMLLSSNL